MYGLLWRKLPGNAALKALESILLAGAVCAFLIVVVFPWVEPKLPFSENTVDGGGSSVTSPSSTPTSSTTPTGTSTGSAEPTRVPSTSDVPDVLPGD